VNKILLNRFNFLLETIGSFFLLNAGSFWSSALHDEQAGSQRNREQLPVVRVINLCVMSVIPTLHHNGTNCLCS